MVYLLGASGYVGKAFECLFLKNRIAFRSLKRSELDYSDVSTLVAALRADKPEFVINAAGYTGKPNVDACEVNQAACLEGNSVLPGRIALACAELRIPWGHVSSGCIYTGCRSDGTGFSETDKPNFTFRQNNCSFYSGTKALGEEVLKDVDNVYIWRLRIPFDYRDGPRNYLSKLMRYDNLLEATNSISQLQEFVSAAFDCWQKRVPFGVYNVTNPGYVTTRGVVDQILASGVVKKEFKFFKDENEFMRNAAKVPRSNCILNSDKLRSVGINLTEVHEAINLDLKRWEGAGL
jgi:dTDP-4-dehydrorhamnose reductase